MMRRGLMAAAAAALSLAAWAFKPPVDTQDGVTLRILGFDERKDAPCADAAVRRDATQPFTVRVTASNAGTASVTGTFRAWVNDDWETENVPPADLALAPGETRTLAFGVRAKPGRVLDALYPIHVSFARPGGEIVHPVAVFRAELPARADAQPAARLPKKGRVRLDRLPATTWTDVKGRTALLADGQTGAAFAPAQVAAEGGVRSGFSCHPPWQGGAGVMGRDIPLALPKTRPCAFRFATALGAQPRTGATSDGVEYKVFILEGEKATEVFTRFSAAQAWEDGVVDLSPWAGKTVILRLWVGPGPKMDTTCDRCAWADPVLEIGRLPSAPTEAAWAARESQAKAAARKACGGAADPRRLRFALKGPDGSFGAAWALGPQGVLDGVLTFSDGARELSQRGFVCEVDGDVVGGVRAGRSCACVAVAADGDAALVTHWLEPRADGDAAIPLRVRIWAERDVLRMAWDMPGVTRTARGEPRYTALGLGEGSLPAARAYAGFGNVIEEPREFSLAADGSILSTRHVGADYANGLSLVQATDVFPDALACSRSRKRYALMTHHDATFTFVPSARGAFAAARRFRDVSGYAPAPGVPALLGRMCLDQWWGTDYAGLSAGVARAAKYGLRDVVFVKHDWQRWGYDYRLPDVCPPRGDAAAFRGLREACTRAGWLFLPHDNFIDFYPDAEGYTYDRMVFNPDGTPQKAWLNGSAQSYRWAPHLFRPWLDRNAALLRDAAAPDGIFIDVFTAIAPMDYYDRAGVFYPKMRTQREWGAAFDAYRVGLGKPAGVTISEAGTDALVGHLDGGQSDHFHARRWMSETAFADAERTPWHDMATHGSFVLFAGGLGDQRYSAPDWTRWGDTALHGYASDDYLSLTVMGGRAPMCDGPFSRRAVMTYWLLHDVCAALAHASFETLTFGGNIHRQRTTFSNGGVVWANRETNAVWTVAEGVTLPPYGFWATAPGVSAGVVVRDGRRCAFATAPGLTFVDARPPARHVRLSAAEARRLDVNADGARVGFDGIRTDGAFRLDRRSAAAWTLTPLPDSDPFRVRLDLDALDAAGRRIARIEGIEAEPGAGAVVWRQKGEQVAFSADARAFAYRLVFADGTAPAADAAADDPGLSVECRPRGGLPNALARLRAGETVRLAYLGGSITQANPGWRAMTRDWFAAQFPKARIEEIDASISGTGSDFGACRLATDVLAKKPDLLFVEFRVNGSAGFDGPSVESIIRQTWTANPHTDICLVYTLGEWMLKPLAAGRQTEFGAAMETLANHYGIPSIDFAPEIVRRLAEGSLLFKPTRGALKAEAIQHADAKRSDEDGVLVFTRDGCHPVKEGHVIYRDVVARAMETAIFPASGTAARAHALPPAQSRNAWLTAALVPSAAILSGEPWHGIDTAKDPVYRATYERTHRMLRGGVWTDREGASVTLRWTGTTVGFSDIPQSREDPMILAVSVDGGTPFEVKRARTDEPHVYSRFWYLPEQPWGEHTATVTLKRLPKGQRWILGQFLVAGERLRGK